MSLERTVVDQSINQSRNISLHSSLKLRDKNMNKISKADYIKWDIKPKNAPWNSKVSRFRLKNLMPGWSDGDRLSHAAYEKARSSNFNRLRGWLVVRIGRRCRTAVVNIVIWHWEHNLFLTLALVQLLTYPVHTRREHYRTFSPDLSPGQFPWTFFSHRVSSTPEHSPVHCPVVAKTAGGSPGKNYLGE